jgi:hypothetical protein
MDQDPYRRIGNPAYGQPQPQPYVQPPRYPAPPPKKPKPRWFWPAILGGVAVLLVSGLIMHAVAPHKDAAKTDASPSPSSTPASSAPVVRSDAQILADYDGDTYPVTAYQRALDKLRPHCTESTHQVAAETYGAQQDLAKHDITETNFQVLEHLEGAASAGPREDCRGLLAAYLVLREKG